MNGTPFSEQNPGSSNEEDISRGAERITLARVDGDASALDPAVTRIFLTDERAPLAQMGEDWGAVCEAFRQRVDTYARAPGILLHSGDKITLQYPDQAALVILVLEMENGRARVAVSAQ